jgi:hypothetical protein
LTSAYTVSMCGVATPVSRPSSMTDPSSASISGSRPASMSCSIDVLCLPTFSAPAMRFSMVTRNSMPSLFAIDFASVIIACASVRVSGYWQRSTSVECVSALIGLKERLPQSLSQISARMSSRIGDFSPAATNACERSVMRSVVVPSSSPSG